MYSLPTAAPADGAEWPRSWPSSFSRLCSLRAAAAAGSESLAASGCVETIVFSREEKEEEERGEEGGGQEGETEGAGRWRVGWRRKQRGRREREIKSSRVREGKRDGTTPAQRCEIRCSEATADQRGARGRMKNGEKGGEREHLIRAVEEFADVRRENSHGCTN